jgi:hypothetical protein
MGSPTLVTDRNSISGERKTITITNLGSGLLAWRAKPGQPWIHVDKQGGIALGADVPCTPGNTCERNARLTISVDDNPDPGWVDFESLSTGQVWRVAVTQPVYDVNCDGRTDAIDALLLLQFSALLISELPCQINGDFNGDGSVDVLDALLILQFNAGML